MKSLKTQKIARVRRRIILLLVAVLLISPLGSISAQASDYPLFFPDEYYIEKNVGQKINLKYDIYPVYKNERISIDIYDHSGKWVAGIERDFYNEYDTPFSYSVSWNTKGSEAGEYLVVASMEFYTYYTWYECPTSQKTYITLNETRPAKQAVKSAKAQKGKKLNVAWKKDSKANGYQLQYCMDRKFKKGAKSVIVKTNKTTSKTVTKLKKGKRYYVRVRSYKNIKKNGKSQKLYGEWSSVKRSAAIK